jgi:hypothetical protein
MSNKVQLFPARPNVGKDVVTPEWFSEGMAKKMVKTKLWSYTPVATTQDDINLMLDRAKGELKADSEAIALEKERLKAEREELEALRAELLTKTKVDGRKKTEV